MLPGKWKDWEVVEELGSGSYGTVYQIEKNDRTMAVKVIEIPQKNEYNQIMKEHGQDAEAYCKSIAQNFETEIRTLEMLRDCENIITIEDYIIEKKEDDIGWTIFIVMECLESFPEYSISRVIDEEILIRMAIEITTALCACEEKGVMHRDIKPENILVDQNGRFLLCDFGLARQFEYKKQVSSVKGTYKYMAPEVYHGQAYDGTADIYSLGLILYEYMNRRRMPFIPADKKMVYFKDQEESLASRMSGEVMPAPCEASAEFSDIILRMTAFQQEDRYKSAKELLKDLQALKKGSYRISKKSIFQRERKLNCNNCGKANPYSSKFCTFCGCKLNIQVPSPVRSSHKKKKLFFIAIPVAAALLIILSLVINKHLMNGRESYAQSYEPCTVIVYNEEVEKIRKDKYNKHGDFEESILYRPGEKKVDVETKYKNEYDNKNRVVRTEYWHQGELFAYIVFEYEGQTRTGKYYDVYYNNNVGNYALKYTSKATLNKKGLPVEIKDYDVDGELSFKQLNTYDKQGYLIKSESLSYNSDPYRRVQSIDYTYKNERPVKATARIETTHDKGGPNEISIEKWEYKYDKTEEEQAYAFLEESVELLENDDYEAFADRYSEVVLHALGSDKVDLETTLRQNDINYNNRDYDIVSSFTVSGEEGPCWGVVIGNYYTENGDNVYYEQELIAFRENGEWVISTMDNYEEYEEGDD